MQVKLKILKGPSQGKELKISRAKFIIGRGDDCHLRVRSDKISRQHCQIDVEGAKVVVRDLGSRNGTLVNGERIEGDLELKAADVIQVGPLQFEVMIDHTLGGKKRPKISGIQEAAARTADTNADDGDITSWLEEADEADRVRRIADPKSRQYKMTESEKPKTDQTDEEPAEDPKKAKKKKDKKKAKQPEPPPEPTEPTAKDSKSAAEESLGRMFGEGK